MFYKNIGNVKHEKHDYEQWSSTGTVNISLTVTWLEEIGGEIGTILLDIGECFNIYSHINIQQYKEHFNQFFIQFFNLCKVKYLIVSTRFKEHLNWENSEQHWVYRFFYVYMANYYIFRQCSCKNITYFVP